VENVSRIHTRPLDYRAAATIPAIKVGVRPSQGWTHAPQIVRGPMRKPAAPRLSYTHKGGVAGIYNRATYDKEKREALNLWAEHLIAMLDGRAAVVVPLKRA
jgi:hypothetical protein